jgi:ubiquinone/menaquinone biosynthesis C-methylase UbiE
MKHIPSDQFLSSMPFSESDILLHSWGFDLTKEYFSIASQVTTDAPFAVELATGTGRMSAVLSGLFSSVITGDLSLSDHERAIARVPMPYRNRVHYVQLNMESLPFRTGSIPLVFCVNTLHEVERPEQCIQEMIRVLSPNGTLVLSDFNKTGFEAMKKIHEIVYHNTHSEGFTTMEKVKQTLSRIFSSLKVVQTPLNAIVIASRKQVSF